MKTKWEPYWILPTDGDPLPSIGSGFRNVQVLIGTKWVRIRAPFNENASRLTLKEWDELPHIQNLGQPMAAVLRELRSHQPQAACKAKDH